MSEALEVYVKESEGEGECVTEEIERRKEKMEKEILHDCNMDSS